MFLLPLILQPASAESGGRFLHIPQSGMVHVWALKAWKDNTVLCELYRSDELQPTGDDIRAYCGEKAYTQWASAAPCSSYVQSGSTSDCTGSFFTYLGYFYRDYTVYAVQPKSSAEYVIDNCQSGTWCSEKPTMIFTGAEPMADYKVTEVHIRMEDKAYDCPRSDVCKVNIPLTTNQGVWAEYWVVSSYGDESDHKTIHIRNLYRGENGGEYLVDIIAPEDAAGQGRDYAALVWDTFPQAAHPDEMVYNIPQDPSALLTDHHLYILAGKLIFTGKVDASECVQNGLLDNRNANTCGEEKTFQTGLESQNQYDQQLLDAGARYSIPPRLVKAIITQETQFWPQPGIEFEYGLGCLSENGVDVLLTWDTEKFLEICKSQYSGEKCAAGYSSLAQDERAVVRGLTLRAVGTDREIDLITRVLRANVDQVNQTMRTVIEDSPARVTTYEDMWSFTVANYHAGNSCITAGVKALMDSDTPVTFENFCSMPTSCANACLYVERVMDYARVE